MKTSFSTLACPDWSLSEVVTAALKYGYDGLELRVIAGELDLWNLSEFQPSKLCATRSAIEDQGLVVACLGSSAVFHSCDLAERERSLDAAIRMAEVAAGLGAPAIRVFGDRIQQGNTRRQTVKWIVDSLSRLAERLKPLNVQVWLETHSDFASSFQVSEILEEVQSPDIGIIWDPANAFAQSKAEPLILSSMSGRIRHVHLKDLAREETGISRYVPVGEGDFPFSTMFASLKEICFDGFVSFEWEKLWHAELAPPEIALPHFIHWWKSRGEA